MAVKEVISSGCGGEVQGKKILRGLKIFKHFTKHKQIMGKTKYFLEKDCGKYFTV